MARQDDFTQTACRRRTYSLGAAMGALWKRRSKARRSAFSSSAVLLHMASLVQQQIDQHASILARSQRISNSSFYFNFNSFGDQECFLNFRFTKRDVTRMVRAIAWPSEQTHTRRNRYGVIPILATCLVLRRVSSPARWTDMELMFGKQRPQLSEIYWEALEHMWSTYGELLSTLSASYIATHAQRYAEAIYEKGRALNNCVGFIDGTVIGIARPKGHRRQRVVYNGHKRKHALKYQAVNAPDGMILHASGPIEGRRHDWTMYVRSTLEEVLPAALQVGSTRFCLFGDSGYNRRWYLEVPFQGAALSPAQQAFNKAMSSIRISVEWIFKEVKMYFTVVDFKRKMKILESPVRLLFLCCMFLSNCRNTIYPSQISQYFDCPLPTLEEYLALSNEN